MCLVRSSVLVITILLVIVPTHPVSSEQPLCATVDHVEGAVPGNEIDIRAALTACRDTTPVAASRATLTTLRRCFAYDPQSGQETERARDQHVVSSVPATGTATFTLPVACSEGITELTAAVTFEATGFAASEPVEVLHLYHQPVPYCRTGLLLVIARRDEAAALQRLRRAVATSPVQGPPELVDLQRAYFELRDDPEAQPVATAAALDALHAAVESTPVQGPLDLWWLSENHQHHRRCRRSLSM